MEELRMNSANIWVVIPAYNEEAVIRSTVSDVVARGYSVVVVDDGSADRTAEAALSAGACVCRHAINLGQGAAVQTGIDYALRQQPAAVVIFDADGQHDSNDIAFIAAPILEGRADVVLGSRFAEEGLVEDIPPLRWWILRVAVWMTRRTTGMKVTDSHNGFKGFSPAAAAKLCITQNRMAHASEILHQISRMGGRVEEVPVHVRYTEYSMRKGQKSLNALNILWDLFAGGIRR
jgi:glycosyltransferase involved in cell wall biosynthesis